MKIKLPRYYIDLNVPGCECCGPSYDLIKDNQGDYLKFEDVEKILKEAGIEVEQ